MAAHDDDLQFYSMSQAKLRQRATANPGRVNEIDSDGETPLCAAVRQFGSVQLVLWLVNKKGADVTAAEGYGDTAFHIADSLDVLDALLGCGADPTPLNRRGYSPVMSQLSYGRVKLALRLLQYPRVRASINLPSRDGWTALHSACCNVNKPEGPASRRRKGGGREGQIAHVVFYT